MSVRTTLSSLALLICGVLALATTSDGAQTAAGDPKTGKATFTQYCSICHGVAGKGFIGPRIGGIDWTAPGLRSIVRGGLGGYGGMPSFNAAAVTDHNVDDIAAYLASLAPPVSVSVADVTPSPVSSAPPAASASASHAVPAPSVTPEFGDVAHGRQVYSVNCSACHGAGAQGGYGPSLRGEKSRKDDAAAIAWIKNPKPPMPKLYPDPLGEKDVKDVAAYIESL
jgi:mono/diheme cytochrome c family protein